MVIVSLADKEGENLSMAYISHNMPHVIDTLLTDTLVKMCGYYYLFE